MMGLAMPGRNARGEADWGVPRPLSSGDQRERADRRNLLDRRSGIDQRSGDRRLAPVTAKPERRVGRDRRAGVDRRKPSVRRGVLERRGPESVAEHIRNALQLLANVAESGRLDLEQLRDLDAAMFRLRFAVDRLERAAD